MTGDDAETDDLNANQDGDRRNQERMIVQAEPGRQHDGPGE